MAGDTLLVWLYSIIQQGTFRINIMVINHHIHNIFTYTAKRNVTQVHFLAVFV